MNVIRFFWYQKDTILRDPTPPSQFDDIFQKIKEKLPPGWMAMDEAMRLHHLMSAVNACLKPMGNWILVNGDLSLLELLGDSGSNEK